jgi:hypothetical protein
MHLYLINITVGNINLREELNNSAANFCMSGEIIVLYRENVLSHSSHFSSLILFHVAAVSLSLAAIPVLRESGSTFFF